MKTTLLFLCMAFFTSIAFSQINPSNDKSEKASGEDSKANMLVQFTPNQADWSTFQSKAVTDNNNVNSHDPNGITWINSWPTWDGTVYNPTEMYNETGNSNSFFNAICPTGDKIRGIREVFYANNPFADNENPTKAEVDEWHRIALNHLRALVGYNVSEDPADAEISYAVEKDHCMFARALWGQERKFTTKWDADYPTDTCEGNRGISSHCGASFIPSLEDQAPYLPEGHPGCGLPGGAEGITPAPKSNIPWSVKWSRGLCSYLGNETFWGGHVGPFFHRKKFGFSFWDIDVPNANSNAVLRAKWTGPLMENIYPDPRNLSISDLENSALSSKLFPNPVDNELNIELAPGFNLNETKVNVMNTMGVMVASYPYKASIDVSKMASGVYILQLNDGKNSQAIKFIKK